MAAERASAPQDEGMDILKFFIAIMGFLTLLVAVMAILNWAKVNELRDEIETNVADYERLQQVAGSKELRELIAKDRASKDLVDVLKKDLGEFLQQTAARMGISFATFEKLGAGGFRQAGFDKISYKFTIDKQSLDVVTEFLFYLQLAWPGLKIEDLTVIEPGLKKDEPFPGWRTIVTVSIFRPKTAS